MQRKDAWLFIFGFAPSTPTICGLFFAQNQHKVGKIMGRDKF
jgi:hypothetical protein